jgi:hypothetical protein
MMKKPYFITMLNITYIGNKVNLLVSPFRVYSAVLDCIIEVITGFYNDGESVPRLPIVYDLFGNTSLRSGVIHDFLSRSNCPIKVTKKQAACVYYEFCRLTGNSRFQAYAKYIAVLYAPGYWHKHTVEYIPKKDCI